MQAPVMPMNPFALYNAPLMPFTTPAPLNNSPGLVTPVKESPLAPANEGRKGRRRGGKAVRERRERLKARWAPEKRVDPTDGIERTWEEFMMKHALGACFDEADRLWAMAENDDDEPPPLVDEEEDSPISEGPGTPPSISFFESGLESSRDESVGFSDSLTPKTPSSRMINAAMNEQ